jgi:lipopolysaccharide exporter
MDLEGSLLALGLGRGVAMTMRVHRRTRHRDARDEDGDAKAPAGQLQRLVARGAAWTALSNVLMRAASLGIVAVVARLLSPEDFGTFALTLAAYMVIASVAELGMASAIARAPTSPDDIAPTVTTISIAVSTTLSVALALWAPQVAAALGSADTAGPLRVMAICLFLTGVFAVPGGQLTREFRQDRMLLANVIGFLPSNALLIGLAFHGSGPMAFAWSRVLGQVIAGLVMVASVSHLYRPGWSRSVVRPLLRFGLPLSIANLVNWSLLNVDFVVVGHALDEAHVGIYMAAFSLASLSTAVLGSVLNSVVVPAFGRVAQDGKALQQALVTATRLVALVAMPVGAMTLVLARPLIGTVYGSPWAAGVPVLQVLSGYGVLFAFSLLYANVLVALGATGRLLLIQVIWIAALVPVMIMAVRWWGLVGVAASHIVVVVVVAIPAYALAIRRTAPGSVRAMARASAAPAAAAAGAAAMGGLTSLAVEPPLLQLLVGACAGGVTYLVLAFPMLTPYLPSAWFLRVRHRPSHQPLRDTKTARWEPMALLLQRCTSVLPRRLREVLKSVVPGRMRHVVPASLAEWNTPLVEHGPPPCTDDETPRPPPLGPSTTRRATETGKVPQFRCLIVTSSLNVGGLDAFAAFLARGLPAHGMETLVLVTVDGDPTVVGRHAELLRHEGFSVSVKDASSGPDYIRQAHADVLSVHGAPDWVVETAHEVGVPIVETLHGMHDFFDVAPGRSSTRYAALEAVVSVSALVRRQFLQSCPTFPDERAVVIPNGVAPRYEVPSVRKAVRDSLGLTDEFLFVSLARHCLQKNGYGVASAFADVAAAEPSVHLVMAGAPEDLTYLAQVSGLRSTMAGGDRLHLRNHVPQPSLLLAAADAFVLDSFFEGWSLSSMEALTAGVPVVLSEVGGAREQVEGPVPSGVLVSNPLGDPTAVTWATMSRARFRPQGNRQEIVQAMTQVVADRDAWAERRPQLATVSADRFSPQVCLERHASILRASTRAGVASWRDEEVMS